jgi:hypothetical protein
VVKGDGGVTPLSGPEKSVARFNALKSLDAKKFPQIRFTTDDIRPRSGDAERLLDQALFIADGIPQGRR